MSTGQRRTWTAALVLALACGVLLVADPSSPEGAGRSSQIRPAAAGAEPDRRPNIVLVLTDDQTAEDLRWMRRTRRLLGDSGMSFSDATSPHPLCCPARAMLLTGQYAQNNGVRHNSGPHGGYEAFEPTGSLGTWFTDAGYSTALVGKYLNRYRRSHGREPGWTVWDPLTQGVYDYRDFAFYNNGGPQDVYRGHYVTRAIEQRSNRLIEEFSAQEQPFLLLSWHVAPHYRFRHDRREAPPAVEPQDRRRFAGVRPPSLRKPSYSAPTSARPQPRFLRGRKAKPAQRVRREFLARIRSLQSVDRAVASLVDTLKRTGEWDNTYVVFTSDNGYSLGEHRYIGKNVLTEEALRVPLLVTGPGIRRGTSDVPATLTDLPATFAGLAGVRPALEQDGHDLSRVLTSKDERSFRDTTLVQTGRSGGDGWDYRGVRTDRYLYAVRGRDGDTVLYDMRRDPHQLENRARDRGYRKVRIELEGRRRTLTGCSGERCNQRFGPVPSPRKVRPGR